jgi:hypothetical protein
MHSVFKDQSRDFYKKERIISKMANVDLSQYGITGTKEIAHNPSYDELFKAETDPSLEGYEKGQGQ